MRVVAVEARTVDLADLLDMAVTTLRRAGAELLESADVQPHEELKCAIAYVAVCERLALDIERAAERFDAAVLRHLEGPCQAH